MHLSLKRYVNLRLDVRLCFNLVRQTQATYDSLQEQISVLAETINSAEDSTFTAFCRKIKVENIREYEERQLKVAQEESEARLRFDNQIARLTHQSVLVRALLFVVFDLLPTGPTLKTKR
jgi:hypothetical protein